TSTAITASETQSSIPKQASVTYPEIIPIQGDGSCAFYAFAIGLMENIFLDTLVLEVTQHASFLRIFGQNILKQTIDVTPEQVKSWVNTHYSSRYEFSTYAQLNPILRMLTSTLVKQHWCKIVDQMLMDLIGYVKQARDDKIGRFDMPSFEKIFQN